MAELAVQGGQEGAGPDGALLVRLRAGEKRAFEDLVRAHFGMLLAVAMRYLGNDADAQDAVQDAFISAFAALPKFEGQSSLGTWLHAIVCRASLMKLRSKRRRKEESGIEALLPTYLDDGHRRDPGAAWDGSPFGAATAAETGRVVRGCIEQLPEEYRVVLLMRDIDGLSNEQAAEVLEMNVNTVKTRLHRARQALRTLLEPHVRKENV